MRSLESDAESDILTDEEEEEYGLNNIRNLSRGDIVRFSTLSADANSAGRVLSIRDGQNIKEIEIEHLDEKQNGQKIVYASTELAWICQQDKNMPETPLKLEDIRPKMYITTEAACGGKVMGWVKRMENRNIILDKNLPYVDDRKTDESDSMDMDIEYADIHNEELIMNWSSIAWVFETILPFPFDANKKRV